MKGSDWTICSLNKRELKVSSQSSGFVEADQDQQRKVPALASPTCFHLLDVCFSPLISPSDVSGLTHIHAGSRVKLYQCIGGIMGKLKSRPQLDFSCPLGSICPSSVVSAAVILTTGCFSISLSVSQPGRHRVSESNTTEQTGAASICIFMPFFH